MRKIKNLFIVSFLVSLVTVLVYLPTLHNDFVNWDDDEYVYENPNIQSIGMKSIKWMFTAFHSANWHPVTWLSHTVDYAIWGLNPMGHHLTSVIFHGINTFLVVILITRLIRLKSENAYHQRYSLIAGAITGLLFGLHPLHVESVAWVSERKDVLYAFFFLLSIVMYIKYVSAEQGKRVLLYGLCLGFFIFSVMSKPMAVTLPAVLLILDVYPLERLSLKNIFTSHRTVLMEKLPLLGLSIVSIVLTVFAQQEIGAIKGLQSATLQDRIFVAFNALMFYIQKILWPKNLVPMYPYPSNVSVFMIEYIVSILLVLGITVCCFYVWRKQKIWLTVWAYYVITLLPVLGIIKVGHQAAADRYTYMSSLGPFLLIGLLVAKLTGRTLTEETGKVFTKLPKVATTIVTTIIFVMLINITVNQQKIWKDAQTIWNSVLKIFPENTYLAYFKLGRFYQSLGQSYKAVEYYKMVIKLYPNDMKTHNNLGNIYKSMGMVNEAIEHYKFAIKIKPYTPELHNNIANAYLSKGLIDKAIRHYKIALEIKDDFANAHYNLAIAYKLKGFTDEAEKHFRIAHQLNPALAKGMKTQQ